MQRFSGFSLLRRGLSGHRDWQPQWRKAEPKPAYDAVIVGGGGHGLGAAYYLAKEHGLTQHRRRSRRAGSAAATPAATPPSSAPTTCCDESAALYDHALKMWEGLSQDLNYNVMFSPARRHDARAYGARRAGVQAARACEPRQRRRQRMADARRRRKAFCPPLQHRRHPLSRARRRPAEARRYRAARCGSVGLCARRRRSGRRHHRELRGHRHPPRRQRRGRRRRDDAAASSQSRKVGVSAAGNTSVVMDMAGVRLPLESYPLQALVSEPVKPIFPCVVMSNTIHAYISQSDKGELVIGAGTDAYTSYTQRGGLHISSHALEAVCELFPHVPPAAHAAQLGRHRRCHARPLARSSPGRRCRACTSTAAGAPAASRRRRARRTSSPGRSRTTSRIRINAPFTHRALPRRPGSSTRPRPRAVAH